MTREKAIRHFERYINDDCYTIEHREACRMAVIALREQEERESVWHDAKNSPPKKPGVYYGKVDETDSMYACQYRDGVWTMNSYPETKMPIIKWAFYDAFVREQEERENRKPLTLDELRQMDGEPVWIDDWFEDFHGWELSEDASDYFDGDSRTVESYGTRWEAYRSKPKEDAR